MMTKTTVVSLFAISLLALTGVGFAAFTSSIYVYGTAGAGTLAVQFNNPATPGTSTPSGAGTCGFSGTGGSTSFTASNLAPGDICTATITVYNTGSLPTTSETTSLSAPVNVCNGANCFYVSDSLGLQSWTATNGFGGPVGIGGSFVYSVSVQLDPGSTVQSESGSFTITLTAST